MNDERQGVSSDDRRNGESEKSMIMASRDVRSYKASNGLDVSVKGVAEKSPVVATVAKTCGSRGRETLTSQPVVHAGWMSRAEAASCGVDSVVAKRASPHIHVHIHVHIHTRMHIKKKKCTRARARAHAHAHTLKKRLFYLCT